MNKKTICSIAIGFVISALPTSAIDETSGLRSQLAAITKRLNELEKSPKTVERPGWIDKIKGDLRYRFEYVGNDKVTSKNRQRIRVRLGAYTDVNDYTTAGVQIRTGQDANSGNQTIGDTFNNKDAYFDLAYMTLAPADTKYGAVTLGKMKYPWKTATDLIWDSDVNPEGVAYSYEITIDHAGLFSTLGYFKVKETSSTHDLNLASGQVGATKPLGEKTRFTLGGSIFAYDNAFEFGTPVDYTIGELFAELGFADVLSIPVKLYGNYVNNTEESTDNQGYCIGIKFGDTKKGAWEAKVGYRELEAYAAPAAFTDSDYAGGGTDIKGVRLKAAYDIGKNLQAGLTCIAGEGITSGIAAKTFHLDLTAKF